MGQDNQHIDSGAGLFIFEPRSQDGVPRIHGDVSPTLNTMGGGQREPCVAYSIQGNTIDRADTAGANGKGVKAEQSFTLNTIDRHAVATIPINTMTVQGRPSDEGRMGTGIGKDGDPAPTITKGHSHAVATIAFNERQQAMTATEDCANTLSATDYKGVQTVAHTFKIRSGCEGGGKGYLGQDEAAFTLDTTQTQTLHHQTAIRRLTPIECERLQGFPDNYTQIPYRGKPPHQCPDGPRYKALGNSMAVPVLKWIGERINEINKLL